MRGWLHAMSFFLVLAAAATLGTPAPAGEVPYVPTPHEVVRLMLEMAEIRPGDVVYDLGCGDARIVIAAVQVPGVRGVCVEIDPRRIAEGQMNAEKVGVADRIRFVQEDLFKVPLREATVVTLYLLPAVNMRLRPRLLSELRPGTRIVSHAFDLGDWEAERREVLGPPEDEYVVFRWTVPAPVPGPARRP